MFRRGIRQMWDPVSVARTFPSLPPRHRRHGETSSGIFFRGHGRERAPRIRSHVQRSMTSGDHPSFHSRGSSFSQAERSRSQALGGDCAEVLTSSPCYSFQPSAHGVSEEICEVEVEAHGLVQIFRTGKKFAARNLERVGPFSRNLDGPALLQGLLRSGRGDERPGPPAAGGPHVIAFTFCPIRLAARRDSSSWAILVSEAAETETLRPAAIRRDAGLPPGFGGGGTIVWSSLTSFATLSGGRTNSAR